MWRWFRSTVSMFPVTACRPNHDLFHLPLPTKFRKIPQNFSKQIKTKPPSTYTQIHISRINQNLIIRTMIIKINGGLCPKRKSISILTKIPARSFKRFKKSVSVSCCIEIWTERKEKKKKIKKTKRILKIWTRWVETRVVVGLEC